MKNMIASAVLGVAALGANAQTQSPNTQTPSSEANQVMTLAQKATADLTRPKVATAGGWSEGQLTGAITGASVHDPKYGNGARVQFVAGDGTLATALTLETLEHASQKLIAMTYVINPSLAVTAVHAERDESANVGLGRQDSPNATLSASKTGIQIDIGSLPALGLTAATIAYVKTRVNDSQLSKTTDKSQISSVIDMREFTRYLTEYYQQDTTVQFTGRDAQTLIANAQFHIGENVGVTIRGGSHRVDGQGAHTAIGLSGQYYGRVGALPYIASAEVAKNIGQNGVSANVKIEAPITQYLSGYAQVNYATGTKPTILAGGQISIGGNNTQKYVRPLAGAPLVAHKIVSTVASASAYHIGPVADMGDVETRVGPKRKTGEDIVDVAKIKEVNKNAPKIQLNGDPVINLTFGQAYTELGATCTDDIDPTCTVVISGTVNTTVVEPQFVTYTATDSAGNVSISMRTVVVGAAGVDAPTTSTVAVTDITTTSAKVTCDLTDANGATGTCTLTNTATGAVIATWPKGADRTITGLTPDTSYTLVLQGEGQKLNPNGTLTPEPVNQVKNFNTNAEVVPDPAPTSAPIGTITIGDNLGMPTSYTLPAVVDSVGRVVSCTISGLPAGFTLASDNRTLNIVADVGGPTPFSGSRTCDAGVPGNPLIQPINGILNDE